MGPRAHAVSRDSRAGAPRLRVALAASALAHLLAASALDAGYASTPSVPRWSMPLDVHIESAPPRPAAAVAVGAEQEKTHPSRARARQVDAARGGDAGASGSRESLALPAQADPTVYSARDLDSLPHPVAPLPLAQLAAGAPGEPVLRLELTVDEHGAVRDVTFTAPRAPGAMERQLRDALATAAFVPARKDGRAVRSRITLSVAIGAAAPAQPH